MRVAASLLMGVAASPLMRVAVSPLMGVAASPLMGVAVSPLMGVSASPLMGGAVSSSMEGAAYRERGVSGRKFCKATPTFTKLCPFSGASFYMYLHSRLMIPFHSIACRVSFPCMTLDFRPWGTSKLAISMWTPMSVIWVGSRTRC